MLRTPSIEHHVSVIKFKLDLHCISWTECIVLLLIQYLDLHAALQDLDTGVSQILAYKVLQVQTCTYEAVQS